MIGVYDENLWPFTFDDNEYTARMERVQALTPDVQRIAWIGRPLPNGEIFKEIAHMHGTAEKMGPFAEIWAEPERNAKGESVSGTLRADPRWVLGFFSFFIFSSFFLVCFCSFSLTRIR